jgi:Gram-negative porin
MKRGFLHRTVRGAPAHGLALALAVAAAGAAAPARADGLPGGNCCADLEERVAELEATTVRKGNRRVSLTLSGQVSRQIMYWNDGHTSDVYSVDNGLNTSRFRFTGNAKISGDVQAGFMMEMDIRIGARSNRRRWILRLRRHPRRRRARGRHRRRGRFRHRHSYRQLVPGE